MQVFSLLRVHRPQGAVAVDGLLDTLLSTWEQFKVLEAFRALLIPHTLEYIGELLLFDLLKWDGGVVQKMLMPIEIHIILILLQLGKVIVLQHGGVGVVEAVGWMMQRGCFPDDGTIVLLLHKYVI